MQSRIWGSQPQIAVPVRPELRPIGGINPGGFGFRDTANQSLTVGSGITRGAHLKGAAAILTTSNNALTRAAAHTDHPFTCLAVGSVGTASARCISSIATTGDKTVRLFTNGSGAFFAQHIGATTNASATIAQVTTFGGWFIVLGVWASPTDVRMYGVGDFAAATRVQTTTNVGALGALDRLAFGAYDGSVKNQQFDGHLNLVQWFRRAFTDAEASQLLQNPWAIFQPLPRRMYAPAIAAAAGVTGPLIGGGHLIGGRPLIGGRLAA